MDHTPSQSQLERLLDLFECAESFPVPVRRQIAMGIVNLLEPSAITVPDVFYGVPLTGHNRAHGWQPEYHRSGLEMFADKLVGANL